MNDSPPLSKGSISHVPDSDILTMTQECFLSANPDFDCVATGALVFSRATGEDRILLIQRALHDSWPGRWEVPGGGCDAEDESIHHSVARELLEESGLVLKDVVREVGEAQIFLTRSRKRVAKFTFEVDVETPVPGVLPEVALDPAEHMDFIWATEEECQLGKKAGGPPSGLGLETMDIEFTSDEQKASILQGFELRRECENLK
ncbi:NUDIX hydrolase domain-like protein [Chaetomium strumarium]|uniref:NUDIX hydrolase domain-like protein n=1 Tax=Chaetomium strumarium TaxID=1170767 RepID=A0AAJ0GKP5_9PEZI|nr:NUDIX hydrolase domain-like protein [Chaetomium strumarium]